MNNKTNEIELILLLSIASFIVCLLIGCNNNIIWDSPIFQIGLFLIMILIIILTYKIANK